MQETVLKINKLSASYGDENIIEEVSFEVKAGEIVCIVGESGSGKSTLLKAIHGFDRVRVTGGQITLGKDISLGLVPQNPGGSFNPIRTYKVQICEALKSNKIDKCMEEVTDTLQLLGLTDAQRILSSRPYELSGGMNQRMAIATTMLLEPNLLLCDEVTSALDVKTAKIVVEQLLKINNLKNTSILMVTHHLGIAAKMADHIGIMKSGRMLEYGVTKEILENPKCDYTRQLLHDVPKLKVCS
jgi:ABC-type glutathione transport system ATPase component